VARPEPDWVHPVRLDGTYRLKWEGYSEPPVTRFSYFAGKVEGGSCVDRQNNGRSARSEGGAIGVM